MPRAVNRKEHLMKKALSVCILLGSIVTAVCGILILIIGIDLELRPDMGAVITFLIAALLIVSPVFAVLLMKNKAFGGILVLLSSAAFLWYISWVQTDDLTVDPAVNIGVWILQAAMIVLTVVRLAVRRSEG